MKALTCVAVRRRLHAFHDEELSLGDQVEVGAHLDWCDDCSATFADLRDLRLALRLATPGRVALTSQADAGFQAGVVARASAEKTVSIGATIHEMFDDMHLVYAGLGAVAAILVCVVVMFGMMRLATTEHPDSLTSTMSLLAPPMPDLSPVWPVAGILMPHALDDVILVVPETEGRDDSAFTFSGVVTREGHIVNVELYPESGRVPLEGSSEAREFENLVGAVSKVRFEPGRIDGLPVAVNMVWLVAQTTVHATKSGFSLPTVKKRQASMTVRPASTLSTAA